MMRSFRLPLLFVMALSIFSLAACGSTPSITTTSLPNGVVGQSYSTQLVGSNVDAWSVSTGSLPDGLSVSSAGVISGTPTTAGTFSFTVDATKDTSTSPSTTKDLSITITAS